MTVIDRSDQDTRWAASDDQRAGASIDEAVTGPLPITDLVEGHLHVTERRGVVIASLDGGLESGLAERVTPELQRVVSDAAAVILDIDRATLLDRSALDTVLDAVDAAPEHAPRCLIAGRLSGRMVLDRWMVTGRYAIFSSIPDALQARAFADSGYGNGWTPSPNGHV